nr:hypothetical protein [Phytoactinopolyspora limicola]
MQTPSRQVAARRRDEGGLRADGDARLQAVTRSGDQELGDEFNFDGHAEGKAGYADRGSGMAATFAEDIME